LLPSGKVLVAAGRGSSGFLSSAGGRFFLTQLT